MSNVKYGQIDASTQQSHANVLSGLHEEPLELRREAWGLLPVLSLVSAIGLLIIVFAYDIARNEMQGAELLRWVGLAIIFGPIAKRLISEQATRHERIGLLLVLGMVLYLVKVLYSPLDFRFVDELMHWRTTFTTAETGRLFQENSYLPISPMYPGLENITVAFYQLSGLGITEAGLIVVGVVRIVFVLALYLFYEQLTGSQRAASIASIVYITSPHYLFFNSMYSYQSLALPLAGLVLYAVAASQEATRERAIGLGFVAILGLAAVTVTHHITSYAIMGLLVVWMCVTVFLRRINSHQHVLVWPAVSAIVMCAFWTWYTIDVTLIHITAPARRSFNQIVGLVNGEAALSAVRLPDNPLVELVISGAGVGLIAMLLPVGIILILRQYRSKALAWTMVVSALVYYATLVARLAPQGAEIAGRTWSFIYLPIAFVLTLVLLRLDAPGLWLGARRVVGLVGVTLLFMSSITAGYPLHWARLPGPYLVSAFERSIEPQGVAAAHWTRAALGTNNRFAADATNTSLVGSYGEQSPVRGMATVFMSPEFEFRQFQFIERMQVRYFVVDHRLTQSLPKSGRYYDFGEPNEHRHIAPVQQRALDKFDNVFLVGRVFDSGDIIIYDFKDIINGRQED